MPWDFEALRPPRSRSADHNDHRLAARRRLEAVAKVLATRSKKEVKLEVRTSIHNPFPPVNGGRVERLWAYATRAKAAVTVFGEADEVAAAVRDRQRRASGLAARLAEALGARSDAA